MHLFGFTKTDREQTLINSGKIKDLELKFDFISEDEERGLLKHIDDSVWLRDLKRRVQHYGYKYDYRSRKIDHSFYLGKIPQWMSFLSQRLIDKGIIQFLPDQAIVNDYVENQGIAPHIDCEPCFGDVIISISLNGSCVMNFQREANTKSEDKIPLFIPPRTLIAMKGESRYKWYHGIPNRKSDKFNGKVHLRTRRVSVTFRKIILEGSEQCEL